MAVTDMNETTPAARQLREKPGTLDEARPPHPIREVVQGRVLAEEYEVAGAMLTRSTSGGYSVIHGGDYVGYLHASVGDKFNVYLRKPSSLDEWLGKYRLEDGVKAILCACDRTAGEERRDAA